MTDRPHWLARDRLRLNIRRLMYQTLIWPAVLGNDARRLCAAFDAEDLQRAADALVDGVRRNAELAGNFLGRKMLIDQPQAVELAGAQPRNPLQDVEF